ncbi:hypothetical protein GCM10008171_13340 [Methylopila jiangsuensis]|uniref:HdeD family acid-resistance protein n=1 Tax=Methylopila jiangsuensis TaxID=586230 RepID=A0A9W6JEF8_9HYPH|nr:HdeD family acid-resistance protein [Methylopila jiangsuensis]MDR6286317.1 uncharacterized membrane protein HdeD (DUF308 family) [Methylopila jiangsuensis]GLK76080.1 hypothetical protein GCM10008171_13340 [Methylopila jiangsuensis]
MTTTGSDLGGPRSLGDALAEARSNWGWFVALGVGLILCGLLAAFNLLAATLASMLVVAVAMIAGGVLNVVAAFRARSWGRFALWLAAGLLYLLSGVLVIANPLLASAVLTLFAAAALFVSGALRIWVGLSARPHEGWGWIVFAGALSAVAGVVIATGWPVNSLWVIGLFLALDLLTHGWAYVALGLALRSRPL